jgi:heme exporter protein B
MTSLAAILVRDMRIAVRVGGGALMGVLFFLVVVTLVPFALGPDLALLKRIGPAILWLAALLASLLALDRLFAADHDDGSLDLILMGHAPLEIVVAVKGLAHWLTTGLPLIIAAPFIGLFLNLDAPAAAALVLTLLVGTPALTFIGLIGAAIAVTLRRGGLLLAVLVLPLTVPVLIFGVAAANAAVVGPVPFGTPRGPVEGVAADPRYLDISVPPGKRKTLTVELERHAFAYVFEGSGDFRAASEPFGVLTEKTDGVNEILVREQTGNRSLVLFDSGDEVTVQAGDEGIRFILVSGKPIKEPVAWHGPIVMNSQAELQQAFTELRSGTFIR